MARKYRKLTFRDRKTIEKMCKCDKSTAEIAEAMDVTRATIYRELHRGGGSRQVYNAETAQRTLFN